MYVYTEGERTSFNRTHQETSKMFYMHKRQEIIMGAEEGGNNVVKHDGSNTYTLTPCNKCCIIT